MCFDYAAYDNRFKTSASRRTVGIITLYLQLSAKVKSNNEVVRQQHVMIE